MDSYEKALRKIKADERCRINCCCTSLVGPTGPTDTYDYFFNKLNRNYSSFNFL